MNQTPGLLVVGGHARSGTTMLTKLLNSHPKIFVSNEFKNCLRFDLPYQEHLAGLRSNWIKYPIIEAYPGVNRVGLRIQSYRFSRQYQRHLSAYGDQVIGDHEIRTTLGKIYPSATLVGDKMPHYVFSLRRRRGLSGVTQLVIYRDVRDVVRSAIQMSKTSWQKSHFVENVNTPRKVAKKWVDAITKMRRNVDATIVVQYEKLVTDTPVVVSDLANQLSVDASGFDLTDIRSSSIGLYRGGLSEEDLRQVIEVAGPTMEQLGYV